MHTLQHALCLGQATHSFHGQFPWGCDQQTSPNGNRDTLQLDAQCLTSCSCCDGILSLCKSSNSQGLASAMRQHSCATNCLIAPFRIGPEVDRNLYCLIKLGPGICLRTKAVFLPFEFCLLDYAVQNSAALCTVSPLLHLLPAE